MMNLFFTFLVFANASVNEPNEFSEKVFRVVVQNDYAVYSKMLHTDCKFLEFSEKAFGLRSHVLQKLKAGFKVESLSLAAYQGVRLKSGNPRVDTYTIVPSHFAVVWPMESVDSRAVRVDLNPLIKTAQGFPGRTD